jgi:hypothetical protein
MAARVFTSFDFDHDESLRNLLVGQARNPDSPFEIADWSVKEPLAALLTAPHGKQAPPETKRHRITIYR